MKYVYVALLALAASCAMYGEAYAQVPVPSDSALIPSGLSVGDQFRVLFVTSITHPATSTVISTYDGFVQSRAEAGHVIRDWAGQFRAVASTSAVDARDHASLTGTGVPVYWLGGERIAADYSAFWNSTWENWATSDRRTEQGIAPTGTVLNDWVWTGTDEDGTKATGNELGAADNTAARGGFDGNSSPWNHAPGVANTSQSHALYGISPVFEVVDASALVAPAGTVEVPAAWGYVPDGLGPGDRFRLIWTSHYHGFVTHDVSIYNIWASASTFGTPLAPHADAARALVHTTSTSIYDNTDTAYTLPGQGPPIYWAGGGRVADDYHDFYENDWGSERPRDVRGDLIKYEACYQATTPGGCPNQGFVSYNNHVFVTGLGGKPAGGQYMGCGTASGAGPLDSRHCKRGTLYGVLLISPTFWVAGAADARPTVGVTAGFGGVEGDTVSFTVSVSGPGIDGGSATTVHYTVSQVGDVLDKGGLGPGSVTVSGTSGTIDVQSKDDDFDEAGGSIRVALVPQNGYIIDGAAASASAAVMDDDADTNFVKFTGATGGRPLSNPTYNDTHATVHLMEGDKNGNATITYQLSVAPRGHYTPEISFPDFGNEFNRISCYTGDVMNDGNTTTREPGFPGFVGPYEFTYQPDYGREGLVDTLSHCGGGYTDGFAAPSIDANNWDGTHSIKIWAGQDGDIRDHTYDIVFLDKIPRLTLSGIGGYRASDPALYNYYFSTTSGADIAARNFWPEVRSVITVHITDDDEVPLPGYGSRPLDDGTGPRIGGFGGAAYAVSVTGSSAGMEGDDVIFHIGANPPPPSPLAVNVTVSHTGDILSGAQSGNRTVTVQNGTASVTIPTVEDDVQEGDDTVTLTILPGDGYAPGAAHTETVSVPDDDQARDKLQDKQDATPQQPAINATLIQSVRDLAAQTHHGTDHVDRWNRVLAGFGLYNHTDPMTSTEATANAATYSSPLWPQIATALAALEQYRDSIQDPPADPPTQDPPQQDTPQDPPYTVPESLVQGVRDLASQTHHGSDHVDRWTRALAGLGHATHASPMTSAQATANAAIYSSPLWPQVADALAKLGR